MQITTSRPQTTKQCPFCAETILAAALKCRHCGEFLNTERAKAHYESAAVGPQPDEVFIHRSADIVGNDGGIY